MKTDSQIFAVHHVSTLLENHLLLAAWADDEKSKSLHLDIARERFTDLAEAMGFSVVPDLSKSLVAHVSAAGRPEPSVFRDRPGLSKLLQAPSVRGASLNEGTAR